jgi:DNA-binding XRE family transcriptional regulator
MNNSAIGSSWEELEKELFTPEEIAASDLRVALIGEMIKAREGQGLTQRDMEKLSGVAQPVIARMEKGKTSPSIDTVLKFLVPLGMTLKIAPIAEAK